MKTNKMYQVGDTITLAGSGAFVDGVVCIVTQVDDEGNPVVVQAVEPDERLARLGFIEEEGQYYARTYYWSLN